jgi:hypothetical protein
MKKINIIIIIIILIFSLGCQNISDDLNNNNNLNIYYCSDEDKNADSCSFDYNPVCGNNEITYSNSCFACSSNEIEFWIYGECFFIDSDYAACPKEPNLVCGDDNKTYFNDCVAIAKGVGILYEGSCNLENNCSIDLIMCPDGSFVGRQPPNCEFAPCSLN